MKAQATKKCKAGEVLRMRGVRKIYKMGKVEVHALRGIDLSVARGERLSIIGPSGSGKSTLMHILGLLDRPTSGMVHIDGEDISKMDDNQLSYFRGKEIGFIFQAFYLVPSLDALENVMLPMIFYNVPKEEREKKAREVLGRLGLDDRLHHLPSELSGGQGQRVAIARALVNNPSILLADEPTGNLDSKSGEEVLKVFDQLHEEGRTIITVTHDLSVARRSPRIVRIMDGVVESDAKNEVKKKGG